MGIVSLLGVLKTAAANIPWTKVAQNTPLIVDMLGKAKARIQQNESSQRDLEDHLKLLQDENAKLSKTLVQTTDKLQSLTARVSLLTKMTGVSFLVALAALILGALK